MHWPRHKIGGSAGSILQTNCTDVRSFRGVSSFGGILHSPKLPIGGWGMIHRVASCII